jgi:hypothetical protein
MTATARDTEGMLSMLAKAKNQKPDPEVIATYAEILAPYPPEAVAGAIVALAADASEFFPPVGKIIAAMARWLRGCVAPNGRAPVLSPDDAWRRARLTVAAYQPQTRPRPVSGNPAIDGALRQLGGVVACQWDDHVGEGIVRRRFLDEYERQIATPEHLTWALSPAATAPPAIRAIELPDGELDRLRLEAEQGGRGETFGRLLAWIDERVVVLDGTPPPPPSLIAAPLEQPLTEDQRAELRAGLREAAEKLALRWSLRAATTLHEDDPRWAEAEAIRDGRYPLGPDDGEPVPVPERRHA